MNETKISSFECACHDRGHVIRASHWDWKHKDHIDHEVDFNFMCYYGDYRATRDWSVFSIPKRLWWRVKNALKLLFIGYIEVEDNWQATPEGFNGLRKWMNKTSKAIKDQGGELI